MKKSSVSTLPLEIFSPVQDNFRQNRSRNICRNFSRKFSQLAATFSKICRNFWDSLHMSKPLCPLTCIGKTLADYLYLFHTPSNPVTRHNSATRICPREVPSFVHILITNT